MSGILSGGKSSGSSVTQTTIDEEFKPFFKRAATEAVGALEQTPGGAFPGEFLPAANPLEFSGLQNQLNQARGFQDLGQGLIGLGQQTAAGDFLSPESNPFLQAQLEQVQRLGSQNLFEQQIPGIRSQAISQGAFGGTREGITEALAAGRSQQAISDAQANLLAENFARERALQQGAGELITQGTGLQLFPGQVEQDIGGQLKAFEQDRLLNEALMFQEQQQGPFRPVQAFGDALSVIPAPQTTTVRTRGG